MSWVFSWGIEVRSEEQWGGDQKRGQSHAAWKVPEPLSSSCPQLRHGLEQLWRLQKSLFSRAAVGLTARARQSTLRFPAKSLRYVWEPCSVSGPFSDRAGLSVSSGALGSEERLLARREQRRCTSCQSIQGVENSKRLELSQEVCPQIQLLIINVIELSFVKGSGARLRITM